MAASLKVDQRRQEEDLVEEVERLIGSNPPTPMGSLSPYEGVVSSCVQQCPAAYSGHPQSDHGGAGEPLQLRTTPRG